MCGHKIYRGFNLYMFLSVFIKNVAIMMLRLLFLKGILVSGMKAEVAYKHTTFVAFENILHTFLEKLGESEKYLQLREERQGVA